MPETLETLEGSAGSLWYHYDAAGDVLYLRRPSHRDTPAIGEETDDGLIVLRSEHDDAAIGLTVVNWWKRFGSGDLPDSIREIQGRIEPLGARIA